MLKYVLKRLLMLIPVIVGITFLIYLILDLAPGDSAQIILGAEATQEDLQRMREQMGLDQPFLLRYLSYMWNALRGDFGTSWYQGYDVFQMFLEKVPYTFTLGMMANVFAIVLGIPCGVLAAVRHNRPTDFVLTFLSLVMSAAPMFWLGMLMQLFFSLKLGWFPVSGVGSLWSFVLPAIAGGAQIFASYSRITRTWLLDVMRSDYIRTARAKGAREIRVIMKHALRNALLPVVTAMGAGIATVIGGAVVLEKVFAIPGIGSWLTNSISTKDVPIVMCAILIIALFVGIVNLLVDLLYAVIDPRVKLG